MEQLGFDVTVRFRGIVKVTNADGDMKPAEDWVPTNCRPLLQRGVRVTKAGRVIGAVARVKVEEVKRAWHPATSHDYRPASEVVALLG